MNALEWANYPDGLLGALVFVVLLLGFVWLAVWRNGRLKQLRERGPLPQMMQTEAADMSATRAVLVLVAVGLLVAALCQPRYGTRESQVNNLGIDIAIAIDASKSMKVQDIVPDRLEASKIEIRRLLSALSGGRVALVPFAGLAFVQTPLTSDFEVVKSYLNDLQVEDMPRGGTAVGRAIIEAIRALVPRHRLEGTAAESAVEAESEAEVTEFEGSKNKAIILFTDGEDHEGDPIKAAELARELGIRIYTVGVGTAQGRPVPVINEAGKVVGTMKGSDGTTPLFSELNEQLLTELAVATKGDYAHLGSAGLTNELTGAMDKLEKQEYAATFRQIGDDRFHWFAGPALLLLLLELALTTLGWRRRRLA